QRDSPPPMSTPVPYTTLFRSAALYDVASATASAQRISLQGAQAPRAVDEALVAGLANEATHRLRDEFAGQPATLELAGARAASRSEEHTSELQSRENLVCRLL